MYSNEDIKVIERYWKNYSLYKREVALCEKAYSKAALKDDKRYQRMLELITAIDTVYKNLEEPFQKFVQIRYWDDYSEILVWEEVADEMEITKAKAYKMRVFVMRETAEAIGYITEPVGI